MLIGVTLQVDGFKVEGYVNGERWNGFEVPLFTFESAKRIIEHLQTDPAVAYAKVVKGWRGPAFEIKYVDDDDATKYDASEAYLDATGQLLYGIGAYGWCWERVN